jgi:hypothetical protein
MIDRNIIDNRSRPKLLILIKHGRKIEITVISPMLVSVYKSLILKCMLASGV